MFGGSDVVHYRGRRREDSKFMPLLCKDISALVSDLLQSL